MSAPQEQTPATPVYTDSPQRTHASAEYALSHPTEANTEEGPQYVQRAAAVNHRAANAATSSNFQAIDAEADIDRITTLETACLYCQGIGTTRMLLTQIPYFRDVILMSFECHECGARHSELQPANDLQPTGVINTLQIDGVHHTETAQADLNRQIIKSDTAVIRIPELEFEIPSGRGEINTIEGIITQVADNLQGLQAQRVEAAPEQAEAIQRVIDRMRQYAAGDAIFTFQLDDPAGNSYMENPNAPHKDPRAKTKYYERTREQTEALGFQYDEQGNATRQTQSAADSTQQTHGSAAAAFSSADDSKGFEVSAALQSRLDTYFNVTDRAATLPGQCHQCHQSCETRMCVTDLPHFKEVVIMATDCEHCGWRDSEVKPAGRVSKQASRITLKVTNQDDLKRDILKSDTASIEIPELELELMSGTLGGKYTTIEGILADIKQQLSTVNTFSMGDSAQDGQQSKMQQFLERYDRIQSLDEPFTFIMDDPMANIYIYNPHEPQDDPCMTVEHYDRSDEQNEELGLNDINVDNYLTEEQQAELERIQQTESQQPAAADETEVSSQYIDADESSRYDNNEASKLPVKQGGLIKAHNDSED